MNQVFFLWNGQQMAHINNLLNLPRVGENVTFLDSNNKPLTMVVMSLTHEYTHAAEVHVKVQVDF